MKTDEELKALAAHIHYEWSSYEEDVAVAGIAAELKKLQAEAAANAVRNVPPLPQLRVSDDRAAEMRKRYEASRPGEWYVDEFDEIRTKIEVDTGKFGDWAVGACDTLSDSIFAAAAHQDLPDLHADRETLLRMLGDTSQDGLEAYQRGYTAGRKESVSADWIADSMAEMSPEQRVAVLRSIETGYCRYCGFDQAERKCHCGNEE